MAIIIFFVHKIKIHQRRLIAKSKASVWKIVTRAHSFARSNKSQRQLEHCGCRGKYRKEEKKCMNQMNSKRFWLLSSKGCARFSTNVKGLWRASRKSLMREYLLSFENSTSIYVSLPLFFHVQRLCVYVCFFFFAVHSSSPSFESIKSKKKLK